MQAQTYDVIVVGLGAVGGAAVYQLAKRGAQVLGLDAHHPPHTVGSSHGESRITRQAVGEGAAYLPLVRRTDAIWRGLEAETGETLRQETGGLIIDPVGKNAPFHGQQNFVAATVALAAAHGIPHQHLTAGATARLAPTLRVGDDVHAYYEPGAGLLLAETCIRVQLQQAAAHGAILRKGERVTHLEESASGVTVRTGQATYHAGACVLAAGGWTREFLPPPQAGHLQVQRQVMYWFAADDPAAFGLGRFPWVIWIGNHKDDFFAVWPTLPGGQPGVKLMTERYAGHVPMDALNREVSDTERDAMYQTYVARRLRGVQPELLRASACAYTVTPDEHFIIDRHPQAPRVIVASACSGHGFKHAAAVGEALAALAIDAPPPVDVAGFGWGRLATP